MSRANVEIVRRAIDAFNERDLDAVMRALDPDVEVDWSRSRGVEVGVYSGHQRVRRFWATFYEMFDRVEVTAEQFVERGDDVLVPNRGRAWGRDGIEVDARSVAVATIRDGRLVRWRLYQDMADAEAAESDA